MATLQRCIAHPNIALYVYLFLAKGEAVSLAATCKQLAASAISASNAGAGKWRVVRSETVDIGFGAQDLGWCKPSRCVGFSVEMLDQAPLMAAAQSALAVQLTSRHGMEEDIAETSALVTAALSGRAAEWSLSELTMEPVFSELSLQLRNLSVLRLEDCMLGSMAGLHLPQLHTLQVRACDLTALPNELPSLTCLRVSRCPGLARVISCLPASLQVLELSHCPALDALPNPLPCELQELIVADSQRVTELPELPATLQTLNANRCYELARLPAMLPPGLQQLELMWCNVSELPARLPDTLRVLQLHGLRGLDRLPEVLPADLRILNMNACSSIRTIPGPLPAQLRELQAQRCTALTGIPGPLPSQLATLELSHCATLDAIPGPVPQTLEMLRASSCSAMLELPCLAHTRLHTLDVNHSWALTEIGELPNSVHVLNVNCCGSLARLPARLPAQLRTLRVDWCFKLTRLPATLPDTLTLIDASRCSNLVIDHSAIPPGCTLVPP